MRRVPKIFELNALSITLFYLVFALLWILLSDQLLIWITEDPELILKYQTFKGIFFVLMTAAFLFLLIQKSNLKLAEEKQRIDDALIAAGKATWSVNLDTEIIQRSRYHHKIYGFKKRPRNWNLKSFYEMVHPEDVQQVRTKIQDIINNHIPNYQVEYRIITPNNEIKWLESRGTFIFDDQQNPIEVTGVVTDITEKKKLEEEYRREKELFEHIFENIPVMIDINTEDKDGIRVNKAYKEYTGFTDEDVKDPGIFNQVYREPEMRKKARESIKQADSTWQEFENYTKEGEKRIQQWANIKLSDGSTIGIGLDVTEQRKREKEHERDRMELQTVYDNIPLFINLYDKNQDVYRVNDFFEQIVGYTNQDIQEINLIDAMIPKEEQMAAYEHMENADGSWRDFTVITKSGERLNSSWSNIKVNDEMTLGIGMDTTNLRQKERKLEELNVRYKQAEKLARFGHWSRDLRTNASTVSDGFYHIVEIDKKDTEFSFSMLQEVIVDEDWPQFEQALNQAIESGELDIDYRVKKQKSGEIAHIHELGTVDYDEQGNPIKISGTIQDVTELKEFQEKLNLRNKFIETTIENLPIGVAVNQIDSGEATLMNKKFAEIYGWPKEVLTNVTTFFEKIYPDEKYRNEIYERIMRDLNSKDPERMIWQGLTITTQEGEEKIVNAKNIPLYEQNLMISTVVDVTQQVEAEQRLAESEHKYRLFFQKSPLPMWIFNPETLEFVEVNNAAVEHYGYSRDEFRSMNILDIRPESDHDKVKKDIATEDSQKNDRGEWQHIKKNGEKINVQVTSTNIDYFGNKFRLILVNDITEQKKAEERVLASLVKGENEERARIARELHDGLGQYLAAANMNLDVVQSNINELDERTQKQFEKGLNLLEHAITETAHISRNLLPRVVDDYGLALAIEALIDNYTSNSQVTINYYHNIQNVELSHDIEFNLYRVAQEGLSNAMKYSQASKINVQLIKDELDLILSIDDNGIGFDPSSSNFKSGLGLQTIKTRAGALGGEVEIDSKPGKGTMLSVIVPIK